MSRDVFATSNITVKVGYPTLQIGHVFTSNQQSCQV